eukprot:TRINITY_DN39834_c0_g1_i1.p1 TRINITY_DN39834_c0_g1~~TRINITY_DN39834_c0_g1_i1.p1  ORF type:complete len:157 (+),score=17.06 TRINITY_DN39834_c0_g1_i1:1-471(+)
MQAEIIQKQVAQIRQDNRQNFVDAASSPADFSQQQLQGFLKTGSLNNKLRQVRSEWTSAHTGGDGIPGRRIASEPDKEYILIDRNPNNNSNASASEKLFGKSNRRKSKFEDPSKYFAAKATRNQSRSGFWTCSRCRHPNIERSTACLLCKTPCTLR